MRYIVLEISQQTSTQLKIESTNSRSPAQVQVSVGPKFFFHPAFQCLNKKDDQSLNYVGLPTYWCSILYIEVPILFHYQVTNLLTQVVVSRNII